MRDKGVLFYKLGSYGLILFALVHTLSFFTDPAELMTNEEDKRVWQIIQTHVFSIGGFSTTTEALFRGFNLYLEILTLFAGLLNVLAAKHHAGNPAFLKSMASVNLIMGGLLVLVTAIFFHLAPLILFGLTAIFFLAAFVLIKN